MAVDANTVVLTVLAVATSVSAYYSHKDKKEAAADRQVVASNAEQVKVTLEASTEEAKTHQHALQSAIKRISDVADDTHTLVNNNMAIQLRLTAVSARALANITKDKDHVRAAEEAELALADHMRKQAAVDRVQQARGDRSGQ